MHLIAKPRRRLTLASAGWFVVLGGFCLLADSPSALGALVAQEVPPPTQQLEDGQTPPGEPSPEAVAPAQDESQADGPPRAGLPDAASQADDHSTDHAADPAHDPANDHAAHDDHGGGHHDPFDLSHLNATPGSTLRQVSVMGMVAPEGGDPLEDPVEWRFDMSMFTVLVFLVLLATLAKFAWKPIVSGLDARESSIAAMIEEAKNNQEQAAQRLQEYEARLAQAATDAQNIVTRAKQDAQSSAEKILADAEAAAIRQRERAVADIEAAKTAALSEIAEKSVDAALGLAGNIVRQKLGRDEHANLIRDALERFPSKS